MATKKEHKRILNLLSQLKDFACENVFNPYNDICNIHDTQDAPNLRLKNLEHYLSACLSLGTETIWVGRDLGYRGGRRTGLALTDEFHLNLAAKNLKTSAFYKSTKTICVKERTASEVWNLINILDRPPFLWNIFPFHPHKKEDPMTNRCHSKKEFMQASFLFLEIMEIYKFKHVFALGRDASIELTHLGVNHTVVRHPSYGGQAEFRKTILTSSAIAPEQKEMNYTLKI